MHFLKTYLFPRLIQFFAVIFLGINLIFIIPRLAPNDPIEAALGRLTAQGATMEPAAVDMLRSTLRELYGLEGSSIVQYGNLWGRLATGNFGPSFAFFPTPCIQLIKEALPWTLGVLLFSTLVSWILGTLLGGLAGFYYKKKWTKVLEYLCIGIRPIPYYIMAFFIVMLFAYIVPLFPLSGGYGFATSPVLSWAFITDIIYHAFLPSFSLIIIGYGAWFLQIRSLSSALTGEDFVVYAEISGIPRHKIATHYVLRNALLPQVTGLGLSLGMIFGGSLITEQVFAYPGLGNLLFIAIKMADYNLIMAITSLSIVGIAISVLIIDLLYPLIDPRVRQL